MRPYKPIFLFPSSFFPLVVALLMFLNLGCKKSPTEVDKPPIVITPPSLELSVDGVSCIEAWIKVKKLNDTTFLPISLNINEKEYFRGFLAETDTVLFVDGLAPSTTYTVKGIILDTLQTAKELKVTTLPTTSHNFTWQTFEFGDYNPSALMDVTIIDENNIWAVGKIYLNDSLGNPDPQVYNAVHWNGSKWELKRIPFYYNSSVLYLSLYSVFAIDEHDVWFEAGIHWDGTSFKQITVNIDFPSNVYGLWGSNNNIYAVGGKGNMAFYNGKSWQKLESGTDFTLTDICGSSNGNIYSAGSKFAEAKGIVLRRNKSGQFETMVEGDIVSKEELFHPKLYGSLSSIWVDENNVLYTGGNLFYQFKNNNWEYVKSLPENYIGGNPGTYYRGYIGSIRGNASNDMIIAGDRNTLKHFNGVDWQQLGLPYSASSDISWGRVAIKGNIAVAVGNEGYKAKIIILKR
ncbi:MAG: glucosyl transferase [Ignavibacteriaceae bacterium]|jgi:hypothetical protein